MNAVRRILAKKGHQVFAVEPGATIREALELLKEKEIGAVLVVSEGHVEGIFSERDYARRGILAARGPETPVSELMTRTVFAVSPEHTSADCLKLMSEKHIRHLPVVDRDRVIGVISIGDVVKEVMAEQQSIISGLENYILGEEHTL